MTKETHYCTRFGWSMDCSAVCGIDIGHATGNKYTFKKRDVDCKKCLKIIKKGK